MSDYSASFVDLCRKALEMCGVEPGQTVAITVTLLLVRRQHQ